MSQQGTDTTPVTGGVDGLPKSALVNGRYRIERKLGAGSIGEVYLAHDEGLHGRQVALKILSQESTANEYLARKFRQEMEALARVSHPGIVAILDSGELSNGRPFLVMQYVEGTTLGVVVRNYRNGMELERVAGIVRQLGHALSVAHEREIIHRDLKPDNIMLQDLGEADERVQIIDFGIAKLKRSKVARSSVPSLVAGSFPYMAPEQLMGNPSAASDTYALGVIAYEMVTGQLPFTAEEPVALLRQQERGVRVSPSTSREDLPAEAGTIILKALSFDASERYRRSRDFGEELFRTLRQPLTLPPATPPPRKELPPTDVVYPRPGLPAEEPKDAAPSGEIAHVLFLDAVGFSRLMVKEQFDLLLELQTIVGSTTDYKRAQALTGRLVALPTGDGMALAFFADLEAPVRCALEIAGAVKGHPRLRLRMGLHTGPVIRIRGISDHTNVTGGGINFAQRVMDCGDAGHILVSKELADFLAQFSDRWAECLHDLGEVSVKHGVKIHIYNLYTEAVGRAERPEKLSAPTRPSRVPDVPPAAQTRDRMLIQIVNVSYSRDERGRESLLYAPVPWGMGEAVADAELVEISSPDLRSRIAAVEVHIRDLTERALSGRNRGERGLETAATELSRYAMPAGGWAGLLPPGVSPQLNVIRDLASEIPWEVLDEPSGGRAALQGCLSYLVSGRARPPVGGREFLVVQDPLGELTRTPSDPQGLCRDHLTRITAMLADMGFEVVTLDGDRATAQRFLTALRSSALLGVYYFGGGSGDSLHLADRQVDAGELRDCGASTPFVWLNVCRAGGTGRASELIRSSAASAFARGGGWKSIVAPRWSIANQHAAQMALDFFEAIGEVPSVGAALTRARTLSYARYEADVPDLGWCAYRLDGDPNRLLPVPAEASPPIVVPRDVPDLAVGRVFDAQWQLDKSIFGFAIDAVLLRAVKRRNLQERAQVNVSDFCAGLVRKGDLTRHLLRELGVEPDVLYEAFGARSEDGPRADALPVTGLLHAADDLEEVLLRQVLAKWEVGDRSDFDPALVRILREADRSAQMHAAEDRTISERDLLEALTTDPTWNAQTLLPPAAEARRVLSGIAAEGRIDANGHLVLTDLDREALEIIETAHLMAQQRGMSGISHRVMMAAFFSDSDGPAARALARVNGIDPELVFFMMMAVSESSSDEPSHGAFGLSMEACRRIVSPIIEAARRSCAGKPIGPEALFEAFREKADPAFKEMLGSFGIDLDALRSAGDPLADLTPGARLVVDQAHELAQARGIPPPIRNRLLLAAFLRVPDGAAAQAFRARHVSPEQTADALLRIAGGTGVRREFAPDDAACALAIRPTLQKARELAGDGASIDEATLFRAFCAVAPPELKQALRTQIDLDDLARGTPTPPQLDRTHFDDETWNLLGESARIARQHGWTEVRSPHLFAAMLRDDSELANAFRRAGEDPHAVRALAIRVVPPGPGSTTTTGPETVSVSKNTLFLLKRARELARRAGREVVTVQDLFTAFRADSSGPLFPLLERLEPASVKTTPRPPDSGALSKEPS